MFKTMLMLFALAGLVPAAEPIQVKGSEQQKKLVKQTKPVYPPEAKKNGVSGTVELEAIIAADGKVTEVKVLKGEPVLAEAAVTAVREWEYEPTLRNGEAVAVVTKVNVNFTLKQ